MNDRPDLVSESELWPVTDVAIELARDINNRTPNESFAYSPQGICFETESDLRDAYGDLNVAVVVGGRQGTDRLMSTREAQDLLDAHAATEEVIYGQEAHLERLASRWGYSSFRDKASADRQTYPTPQELSFQQIAAEGRAQGVPEYDVVDFFYEVSRETTTFPLTPLRSSVDLHRIRARVDMPEFGVSAGDLGGWVEDRRGSNLRGKGWIGKEAVAYGDAVVKDGALLTDNAVIGDKVILCDNAVVSGNVLVEDSVVIGGNSRVMDHAHIRDNVQIKDNVRISGHPEISGNSIISGNAIVEDISSVGGNSIVTDNSLVSGAAVVMDQSHLSGNSWVTNTGVVQDNAKISDNAVIGMDVVVRDNARVSGQSVLWGEIEVSDYAHVTGKSVLNHTQKITGNTVIGQVAEPVSLPGQAYHRDFPTSAKEAVTVQPVHPSASKAGVSSPAQTISLER